MDNYCGECARYDANGRSYYGNEHYCEKKGKTYPANKKACESFVPRAKGGYKPAGCFITTIVCNILGYPDDCEVLELMRHLRENYLKQSDKGRSILNEYDQVGPLISEYIASEGEETAMILLEFYLIPCANLVKENHLEEATTLYLEMVNTLKKRYNLENFQIDETIISSDEDLGKGRIKLKPQMV